jgi:hypothetical protein
MHLAGLSAEQQPAAHLQQQQRHHAGPEAELLHQWRDDDVPEEHQVVEVNDQQGLARGPVRQRVVVDRASEQH